MKLAQHYQKGKSAPRTHGTINGTHCQLILDGGCTSYIVSLNFLKKLGITEIERTNASVMFGDGKFQEVIGIARNLQLRVGQSSLVSVSALCFDVGDKYDFIVGREGLHTLNIGTDWSTHYWYIKTKDAILPLNVYYVKNHLRGDGIDTDEDVPHQEEEDLSEYSDEEEYFDQDDSEEGYLIVEASDDENEGFNQYYGPKEDPEKRLGRLIKNIQDQANIKDAEKDRLIELIYEFKDCFGTDFKHTSTTNLLKFHVDTGDHKPIYKKPYGFLSFSEKETLKKDLQEMDDNAILIPSTHVPGNSKSGGWSFPCRYVPKKGGQKRLATNFRDLNAITVRDPWSMPNVVDDLETLAGADWFACCDLLKAFQQIAVEDESIPKLTIASPWGSYSYRCLPFGILNGPAAFARCVYFALQPFLDRFAVNFYDDCTLYARIKEEMMVNLRMFSEKMREMNLKLNSDKCEFLKNEVEVLGFVVSVAGVSPSPSKKVKKIQEFPRPNNTTGIRAFVNLYGFYRRHIAQFADIAAPMNDLLKKGRRFEWDDDRCEESFKKNLKDAIVDAATLYSISHLPRTNLNYIQMLQKLVLVLH